MTKELTALEALDEMINRFTKVTMEYEKIPMTAVEISRSTHYTIMCFKDLLIPIKMELGALSVIKTKNVDIYGIKHSENVYDYNAGIANEDDFETRLLTVEEYALLKEVLE